MPAKKKASGKKTAKKKTAPKKKVSKKTPAKKAVKKAPAVKKAAKRKVTKKKAAPKKVSQKKEVKKAVPKKKEAESAVAPRPEPVVEKKIERPKKQGIRCEHCDGTGICAAGSPYDKTHGQMFGAKVRLTSCQECLLAAGEHTNSKKLVECRICGGDGEV